MGAENPTKGIERREERELIEAVEEAGTQQRELKVPKFYCK